MPGSFGNAPTDDGATASTASSSKSGVFGRNDATTPPPAGSPGGAGVFGMTVVPGAAGVFGACNAASGRGVQGNGPEAGVSGFSESGTGVLAHSNHGDAIQSFAHDSHRNGVFGHNDAKAPAPPSAGAPVGNGVFGFTEVPNASGVCGAIPASNKQGAGVTGIGPTAGRFFGNVVVTGRLTVDNVGLHEMLDRIRQLEQFVADLQQTVEALIRLSHPPE